MTPRKLLTAPHVARLCGADLKTIHNWVNAGRIRHFRTPGRHLRFRSEDVVEFLEAFGYPVPRELGGQGARPVLLLDPDAASRAKTRRALGRQFEVVAYGCPVDALLAVGREQPAAVALDVRLPGLDGYHLVERLAAMGLTESFPVVVYSAPEVAKRGRWRAAGAAACVSKPAAAKLRERLGELLAEA